jgi:hypothetical protein
VLAVSSTLAQAREKLSSGRSPVAHLVQAAANEIRLSGNLRADGLKERIARQSERIEMSAGDWRLGLRMARCQPAARRVAI